MSTTAKDLIRFLEHVVVSDKNGCWIWRGGLHVKRGHCEYGAFRLGGRGMRANRAVYLLFFGDIPPGMQVLHTCDVSMCVNPRHVYLGDHIRNQRDKKQRGRARAPKGEDQHLAKLDIEQVFAIRAAYAAGATQPYLAEKHGVTQSTISAVVRRRTWSHV